jgi:uncharacterized protein (DUF1697 family)
MAVRTPRHVAFLRAINVGGRIVPMEALRAVFVKMRFAEVETFIASGNVIFRAGAGRREALAEKIAAKLERALGYEVATFLRTDAEVAAISGYRPFPSAGMPNAKRLNIGFLERPLTAAQAKILAGLANEQETFHVHGTEVYWRSEVLQSESKFSNALFERKAGLRATFRGLNTVQKLAAKLHGTAER